jgi:hypothetical protein
VTIRSRVGGWRSGASLLGGQVGGQRRTTVPAGGGVGDPLQIIDEEAVEEVDLHVVLTLVANRPAVHPDPGRLEQVGHTQLAGGQVHQGQQLLMRDRSAHRHPRLGQLRGDAVTRVSGTHLPYRSRMLLRSPVEPAQPPRRSRPGTPGPPDRPRGAGQHNRIQQQPTVLGDVG